jgi:hypothetical protein
MTPEPSPMEERSSPIEWSLDLFLHFVVEIENRFSPFYSILDTSQVDEQRPLRPRLTPARIDNRVVVMWPKVLVRRVFVQADI